MSSQDDPGIFKSATTIRCPFCRQLFPAKWSAVMLVICPACKKDFRIARPDLLETISPPLEES